MASSGSFNTSTKSQGASYPDSLTFAWSVSSQDVTANRSAIDWRLYSRNGSSSYYVTAYQVSASINSTQVVYRNNFQLYGAGATTVGSGTRTIDHNSDGTGRISASAKGGLSANTINISGSSAWDLPAIARATQPTINGQSTNVNFSIPTTSTDDITINLPRASSAFTHDVTLVSGSYSYPIATGAATSASFKIADVQDGVLTSMPSSQSQVYAISVVTRNGSTVIGTKAVIGIFSIVAAEARPLFSDFSYADTNPATVAITGNDQVLISGHSQLSATISPAQAAIARASATMSQYLLSALDLNVAVPYSTETITKLIGDPFQLQPGTFSLTATAVDSRSLSTVVSKQVEIVEYAPPVINAQVERLNGFEEQTTLSIAGVMSLIQVGGVTKNAIDSSSGVQYRYKPSSSSTWPDWTNATSSVDAAGNLTVADIIMNIDNSQGYDFLIQITDKIASSIVLLSVSSGKPILFVHKDKMVGVNKIPTLGALDVEGDIYMNGEKVSISSIPAVDTAVCRVAYTGTAPTAVTNIPLTSSNVTFDGDEALEQGITATVTGNHIKFSYPPGTKWWVLGSGATLRDGAPIVNTTVRSDGGFRNWETAYLANNTGGYSYVPILGPTCITPNPADLFFQWNTGTAGTASIRIDLVFIRIK